MAHVLRVVEGPARGTQAIIDRRLVVCRCSADVNLGDSTVSRAHFAVEPDASGVVVTDALDGPSFVVERTSAAPADADTRRSLRVRIEGEQRVWAVDIECAGDTTTHEVADALAAYLGATGTDIVLYRSSDGLLLDPEARWSKVPLQRGDELVLGPTYVPFHRRVAMSCEKTIVSSAGQ